MLRSCLRIRLQDRAEIMSIETTTNIIVFIASPVSDSKGTRNVNHAGPLTKLRFSWLEPASASPLCWAEKSEINHGPQTDAALAMTSNQNKKFSDLADGSGHFPSFAPVQGFFVTPPNAPPLFRF